MYETTNDQVLAEVEERAERRRYGRELRELVSLIDALVEACEEAHLNRRRQVGPELAAQATGVFASARSLLDRPELGPQSSLQSLSIIDLMEAAWNVEEAAFDRLMPERTHLPEDVGEQDWSSAA